MFLNLKNWMADSPVSPSVFKGWPESRLRFESDGVLAIFPFTSSEGKMGSLSDLRTLSSALYLGIMLCIFSITSCDRPRYPEGEAGFWTYGEWPDHAPTQDSILYVKNENIYLFGFYDAEATLLVESASHPVYHPAGTGFAYQQDSSIYLKFFGVPTALFLTKGLHPSWSADGNKLAFYLPHELRDSSIFDSPQLCLDDYCIQYLDLSQNKLRSVSLNQTLDGYEDIPEIPRFFAWGPGDSILFFSSEHYLGWVDIHSERVEIIESPQENTHFLGPLNWSERKGLLLVGEGQYMASWNGGDWSTKAFDIDLEEQRSWSRSTQADWTPDGEGIVYVVSHKDYIFRKSFNWN